jgi:hypothetical protein
MDMWRATRGSRYGTETSGSVKGGQLVDKKQRDQWPWQYLTVSAYFAKFKQQT